MSARLARRATVAGLSVTSAVALTAGVALSAQGTPNSVDATAASATTTTPQKVQRFEAERTTVTSKTVTVADPTLAYKKTKVARHGNAGVLKTTYRTTYVDGVLKTKRVHTQRLTVAPNPKVVKVGTKGAPITAFGTDSRGYPLIGDPRIDNLNWYAMATCESSNNPRSIDLPYYGAYQFLPSTWRAMGGKGMPHEASLAEQTYRAKLLVKKWGESQFACAYALHK